MSRARELSMGSSRRHRGRGRFEQAPVFTLLRDLTARATLGDDTVRDALRDTIIEAGGRPGRMRFEEGATYNAACTAYTHLTGERIGPETGVL